MPVLYCFQKEAKLNFHKIVPTPVSTLNNVII